MPKWAVVVLAVLVVCGGAIQVGVGMGWLFQEKAGEQQPDAARSGSPAREKEKQSMVAPTIPELEAADDEIAGILGPDLAKLGVHLASDSVERPVFADSDGEVGSVSVDVYCHPRQGEVIARSVARAFLEVLPEQDGVRVWVFWWGSNERRDKRGQELGHWAYSKEVG